MPDHFTDENEGEPMAGNRSSRHLADLIEKAAAQHGRWRVWDDKFTVFSSIPEELLAAVERLQRELHTMQTAGIIEVAVRNSNVAEYMNHWEARATAAEASLVKAREALKPFAAMRLSTEPGVSDLVLRSPAEEMRRQAEAVEAHDRAILAARAILGDQPT